MVHRVYGISAQIMEGAEIEFPAFSATIVTPNCCNRDIKSNDFIMRRPSPIISCHRIHN